MLAILLVPDILARRRLAKGEEVRVAKASAPRWPGAEGGSGPGPPAVDLAFETSGNPRAQADVVDVLRNGGKAAFVGFGATQPAINPSRFIGKQLTLMGSFVAPINAYWDIVRFIRHHRLPLDRVVTHRLPLAEAPSGFALADRAQTGKVMFVWE